MKIELSVHYLPQDQENRDGTWEDAWQVDMTVGNQSFAIGHKYETKEEAEWLLGMFQKALDNADPVCSKCKSHESN
jgi:hypothetical protein